LKNGGHVWSMIMLKDNLIYIKYNVFYDLKK
jgi:hypothetical protein